MKIKALYLTILAVLLLVGCKSNYPVAQQTGKEDISYLFFVGPKETYGDGMFTVQVKVDDTQFDAKVVKPKTANRKGVQYAVAPGRRQLTVSFKGQVIYQKQIFLSPQETKTIELP
jgi:uncharacterized protein YcfL